MQGWRSRKTHLTRCLLLFLVRRRADVGYEKESLWFTVAYRGVGKQERKEAMRRTCIDAYSSSGTSPLATVFDRLCLSCGALTCDPLPGNLSIA